MTIATTLTIGSDTFDVYGETSDPVTDADSYFAGRLGATAWTGAATLAKQQGIVTAARFLDRGVLWSGTKTVTSQALEWPRDGADCRGTAVTAGTLPDNIALAEFELALALLEDETLQDQPSGDGASLKTLRTGPVSMTFFGSPAPAPGVFQRFPQIVHELVDCYAAGGPGDAAPFVSGVNVPANDDQVPHFDSENNSYDMTQGLP